MARKLKRGRPRKPVKLREPNGRAGLEVVDDLSQAIPVAQRELDVIETYLGALLDDALGEPE